MSKLKWVTPTDENIPPKDVELIIKFKHGIISGYFDYERYETDGVFVFKTYIWQDIEGLIYQFISMDAFNSVFQKET